MPKRAPKATKSPGVTSKRRRQAPSSAQHQDNQVDGAASVGHASSPQSAPVPLDQAPIVQPHASYRPLVQIPEEVGPPMNLNIASLAAVVTSSVTDAVMTALQRGGVFAAATQPNSSSPGQTISTDPSPVCPTAALGAPNQIQATGGFPQSTGIAPPISLACQPLYKRVSFIINTDRKSLLLDSPSSVQHGNGYIVKQMTNGAPPGHLVSKKNKKTDIKF